MHQKREKGKNKSVYSCLISMHFIFDWASFLSATFYCNCYNTVEEIGISSSAVLVHEMSWSVSICRGGVLRYCCCHSHFSFQVLAKTGIVLVEVMFFLSAWIDNFSGGNREAALEKRVTPKSTSYRWAGIKASLMYCYGQRKKVSELNILLATMRVNKYIKKFIFIYAFDRWHSDCNHIIHICYSMLDLGFVIFSLVKLLTGMLTWFIPCAIS